MRNSWVSRNRSEAGFTLTEMMVVTGLFLIIVGIVVANVLHLPGQLSLAGTTSSIVSDLKTQQLRSMLGDTEGTSTAKTYGINFLGNKYVEYGAPYNSNDVSNFTVNLGADLLVTTSLPSGQITFNRISGEVTGFTPGSNTVTVTNIYTGEQKMLIINRYGAITIQ